MDHDRFAVSRTRRLSPKAAALCLVVAAGLGSGCETPTLPELPSLPGLPALPELPGIPGVYRIDIQQGNIVDQAMLDRLEIGMESSKVRFILGTPLLIDPFNENRWDYVYSLRRGSGEEVRQRVSVYFADDRLARIEADFASAAIPELTAERTQTRVKVPKRPPPKGFLDRLTPDFLSGDDDPANTAAQSGTQPEEE